MSVCLPVCFSKYTSKQRYVGRIMINGCVRRANISSIQSRGSSKVCECCERPNAETLGARDANAFDKINHSQGRNDEKWGPLLGSARLGLARLDSLVGSSPGSKCGRQPASKLRHNRVAAATIIIIICMGGAPFSLSRPDRRERRGEEEEEEDLDLDRSRDKTKTKQRGENLLVLSVRLVRTSERASGWRQLLLPNDVDSKQLNCTSNWLTTANCQTVSFPFVLFVSRRN